jgi:DNA-binding transcriptional regulator YhcF (GntR family)
MLIELAGLCSNHRMKNSSPTFSPLYRQIKSLAIQALASGEWQPGQAIPSEQELAQRFQVSQGTVRKAIDEMVAENLLMRRQGKGTFVTSHTDPRALFRFLRLTPDSGERVPLENIPFDCRHARAGQEVARNLDLEPGAPVVMVPMASALGGPAGPTSAESAMRLAQVPPTSRHWMWVAVVWSSTLRPSSPVMAASDTRSVHAASPT